MLTAVVLVTMAFELPKDFFAIVEYFWDGAQRQQFAKWIDIFDLMTLVDQTLNFVLYCSMSREFRRTFKDMFVRKPTLVVHDSARKTIESVNTLRNTIGSLDSVKKTLSSIETVREALSGSLDNVLKSLGGSMDRVNVRVQSSQQLRQENISLPNLHTSVDMKTSSRASRV